jgi:hypothetical protein
MLRIVLILTVAIESCNGSVAPGRKPDSQPSSSPIASLDYSWKSGLFPFINERTNIAGLKKLEAMRLPPDDLEVRIWHGFGLIVPAGVVLKRSAGNWTAIYLASVSKKRHRGDSERIINEPKSGWQSCWSRLTNAGVLTLPDATQLGKEPVDPDVLSYVVELNIGGDYRTYHYTYPEANVHTEAKQMIEIGDIIAEEFGTPQFRTQR